MFTRLLSEVESIRSSYGFEISEALQFIQTHITEYSDSPELVDEYFLFVEHGKELLE